MGLLLHKKRSVFLARRVHHVCNSHHRRPYIKSPELSYLLILMNNLKSQPPPQNIYLRVLQRAEISKLRWIKKYETREKKNPRDTGSLIS